jgi:type IV pilus assembly protein PilX
MRRPSSLPPQPVPGVQRGFSLMIVLIILTVVSMLGLAGIGIATMSERGARNDRDQQIAWQAAEAALIDAEQDLYGPGASTRRALFGATPDLDAFVPGCGTTSTNRGLCSGVAAGLPAWMTVDFSDDSDTAPTAAFGQFTARTFQAGGPGVQPEKPPRYVIEVMRDPGDRDVTTIHPHYIYRVTAMGFGPRADIQAVVQMLYRI